MSQKTPQCIGIIMDGNRRWAKSKGLPTFEGHRQGYQSMRQTVEWAKEAGVGTVIFFAFSEENWKRTADEVSYLMGLIKKMLVDEMEEIITQNVRLRFIGDISKFSPDIQAGMRDAEKKSKKNTGINVGLAVSYGGRQEIVSTVNTLLAEGKTEVTIEDVSTHLYTNGLPDPDMIIRTSGEMRLSGFLTWQSIYSELFFTNTLWPDFSKDEFLKMIEEYSARDRRLGK
jgi:undecaprenyl diphosphate synthase